MTRTSRIEELQSRINAIEEGSLKDGILRRAERPGKRQTKQVTGQLYDSERAFKKIIDLLNASDKSERQIRERLKKLEFTAQAIDEAVVRAKEYGFVDDRRFARILVISRISQGKGRCGIERELKSHGIDPLSVEELNDDACGDEGELERALTLLERKPPKSKNLREGAFRKLVQKGYSTSVASNAARIWWDRSRCFYDDASSR